MILGRQMSDYTAASHLQIKVRNNYRLSQFTSVGEKYMICRCPNQRKRHITLNKTAHKLDTAVDTCTALLTTNWV
jgi:hypothetical protein